MATKPKTGSNSHKPTGERLQPTSEKKPTPRSLSNPSRLPEWPAFGITDYTDWLVLSFLKSKSNSKAVEAVLGANPFPDLWAIVYTILVPDWYEKRAPPVSPILNDYTDQPTEQGKGLRELSDKLSQHHLETEPTLNVRYQMSDMDGVIEFENYA